MEKFKHLSEYKFSIAFMAIIIVILFILDEVAGMVGLILAIAIFTEIMYKREEIENNEKNTIEKLSESFDSAAQDSIFNMPFPLVLTNGEGIIEWYNPALLKLIEEKQATGKYVDETIDGFSFNDFVDQENGKSEIKFCDKNYLIFSNKIKKSDGSSLNLFYFVDNNEFDALKKKFISNKISFGHVYIDNYDEIGLGKKGYLKSVILAEIENQIISYFTEEEAIVRKYDDDKFLVVFNRDSLNKIVKDKFSILDTVREIGTRNESNITLSAGISAASDFIPESYEDSREAVDLALGRGGDQVVLKTKDGHEFFGGRTQAREKRNRVRARVIGNTISNLINSASTVYIMGHKNADMDAIGAAIGMLGAVHRKEKEGFIVLNEINPSIKNIMDEMKKSAPELMEFVIPSEEAFERVDKNTSLLFCLDNHKKSMTEEPRLFEMIDKVVVIDHHRKGNDAIENAVLSYIESYASSTSELVTEIIEYMDQNPEISNFEAEAMLAGIVVDTKNFTFQTGVRTFEAASTLRRYGANPTKVNKFFNDDMETVRLRARVIHNADIVKGEIAIARLEEEVDSNVLIAAQAADSLLNIVGIKASFVLTESPNKIHISARSSGEISVQLILEKLGGGGHLVSAGAQLEGKTMEEAYEMLINSIDDYYEEVNMEENEDEDNITEGP